MNDFDASIAVITGAGSGIGRALAKALNQAGCTLAIADINPDSLAETAASLPRAELACHTQVLNVADRVAVNAWAEQVAALDHPVAVVINNAGVALGGSAEENSIEDLEWLMGINFWGVVYGCKAFLPLLRRAGSGHLINISSVFGIVSMPTQSAYNASKFAVRGYTEALRQELASSDIHVCCVHPGGVKTNIARAARSGSDTETHALFADRFDDFAKTTPEQAAAQIVKAMAKRSPRLVIGLDGKVMSLISRLFPTLYPQILRWLAGAKAREMLKQD